MFWHICVAPLAGAWIEIGRVYNDCPALEVAPLAGAWIEIAEMKEDLVEPRPVAPLAGAWIEITRAN